MKITTLPVEPSLRAANDREAGPRPTSTLIASRPPEDRVALSQAARAAAELQAADAGEPADVATVAAVEDIVGSGPPNAELREQVVRLLVDMLADRRLREIRTAREGSSERGREPVEAEPVAEK